MRRFVVALLLPLVLALAGCGTKQNTDLSGTAVSEKPAYSSDTSPEDCYLCGGGIAADINNMPRKILDYYTARERFDEELQKLTT